MKLVPRHRILHVSGLILSALVWLANAGNPPNGRTGAPFDGHCNSCHDGNNPNNYAGTVEVTGVSSPIQPNTTYPLTVTMTTTGSGIPSRGGFQLVVVDGGNFNCGDLTVIAGQGTATETASGREYIEHRNPKNFSGAGSSISWNFNWKSPASANGNTVKMYFIGNFCNGSGDTNDFPTATSETFTFQPPASIEAEITNFTNVTCFGQANGNATVTATGGNGVFTYLWSNGQTSQTVNNVAAGTYTVTVTDSGGGTDTAVANVSQPASALNATASVSNVITCNNPSVSITVAASGGTQPYQYIWSNGDTNATTEVGIAGAYFVTVTDNNGCTKTASANVTQNNVVPFAAATGGVQSCSTNTATVSGQGSSSGPNFTYLWTPPQGGMVISGASSTSAVVSGLGNYLLIVTNITNGCTATATALVTGSAPPTVTTAGANLTCISPTGTISANTSVSPVTYNWQGPGNFTSTAQSPSVSATGVYTVTVTANSSGCSSIATATVTSDFAAPNLSVAVAPATCLVPTCTAVASSTTPNTTYAWNSGQTGATVTLSPGGPYTVTVTSSTNGCTTSSQVAYVADTAPPVISVSGGILNCNTLSTTITATANTTNNTYQWSGQGIVSGSANSVVTVNQPGPYTVTVTNTQNGCSGTAIYNILADVAPPVVVIAPPANLNCNNTVVTLDATGSSQGANFTYLWSGAGILSGSGTPTPVVNVGGPYTVNITNTTNGCSAAGTVNVLQRSAVEVAINNVVNPLCFGANSGSALATATGGSGIYTYLWSNGITAAQISGLIAATYTVSVTDSEGCSASGGVIISQPIPVLVTATATPETGQGQNNGSATASASGGSGNYTFMWSNGGSTSVVNGLAPGAYTVTVADGNNCTAVQTVTVNSFNCAFNASLMATNVTCNGAANGTAAVVLQNELLPIVYQWSNLGSTQVQSNLAPGIYTVTVTDASSCTIIVSTNITEPAPIAANATSTAVSAVGLNDGTATANPTGGIGPFTYLWSNNTTTQTIVGLSVGTYTVTVTDLNGCTATQSAFVSPFNCTVSAIVSGLNVTCAGDANGTATATLIGGQNPLTYSWSNGATTSNLTGLLPGVYTVTVLDANGCAATNEILITAPAPLVAAIIDIQNVSCQNENTGFVEIGVSGGGTAPYSFTFPGAGQSLLGPGLYTTTVTNPNGCTTTVDFSIIAIDSIAPVVTCPPNISKCDDGSLTNFNLPSVVDNCIGGTFNYTLLQGLPSGSFFPNGSFLEVFQVSDQAGNTSTCSFTISIFAAPDIALVSIAYDTNGLGTGSINVMPVGGSLPFTYTWLKNGAFFSNEEDLINLSAGVYRLSAVDANGCQVMVAAISILNVVGTITPFSKAGITLAPNPARDWISLKTGAIAPGHLDILDIYGQVVGRFEAGSDFGRLDISHLPPGMYILQLSDEQAQLYVAHFIKIAD